MSRARHFSGPRFEVPEERSAAVRGLSERLAIKAGEAVDRQRFLIPSFGQVPQVADQLKGERRG